MARGFVAGERARQPAKAGTGPQRRETHAAESGPRIERPRSGGRLPPERQAHIHPFAGGRELAQPIPHVLLRHQPDQRQEGLGAQIICVRLELQHAGVVVPPAHVELRVRIALAAVLRAHPSAEQRPAIVRMSEGQLRADLIHPRVRSVGEPRHDSLRAEVEIHALQRRTAAAGRGLERARTRVEPFQIFGQQVPPAGKGDAVRMRLRAPADGVQRTGTFRGGREAQLAAENGGQTRRKARRTEVVQAGQIQIDRAQLELRQLGVPMPETDRSLADDQRARRQIVERQRRRGRALPAEHELGCERELGGAEAIDDDVRSVEFDAQCEQFPISQQLPDIHAHPSARRPREHAQIVPGAKLQAAQVQLRTVPSERGRDRGKGDVVSGLTVDPVLDLGLISRSTIERELHPEQQQSNQCREPRRDEREGLYDPSQVHYINTTSY